MKAVTATCTPKVCFGSAVEAVEFAGSDSWAYLDRYSGELVIIKEVREYDLTCKPAQKMF
jgi:hypothetical protein